MKTNQGIKKIVRESRRAFRIRENLLYYRPEDFEAAERKFVKFVLERGGLQAMASTRGVQLATDPHRLART